MATILEAPILSVLCEEPEGAVVRNVYPMKLTPENMWRFYEKSSQLRTLFSDDINGDFKKFAEMFITLEGDVIMARGLFFVVDDFVGVYYMTHIEIHDAQVHYTFFDRRHIGRTNLTRELLRYAFQKYQFRRLTTEIPMYASEHTFNFVFHLGFKKEGRIRKGQLYKGEWFDVMRLGILREEAEAWESQVITK